MHARWPEVVLSVAASLAAETRGNPLVLGELVPLLTEPQRAGAAPLPVPLPVGARPLSSLTHRVSGLSGDAARLVLLHACAGPGEESLVSAAAVGEGLSLEAALDDAVASRALRVADGVSSLAHPLLRSAVLAHATPAERRTAHGALAAAADALGRRAPAAWHRAATTVGHDDVLARALADLADDRSLGGRALASQALERAAALCSDAETGLAWLARAADEAFLAGDLARTRALAGRVLAADPSPSTRAEILYVLGVAEEYAGSVPRAAELLAEAASSATGLLAVRTLAELAMTCFRLGDLPATPSAPCGSRRSPTRRPRTSGCSPPSPPAGRPRWPATSPPRSAARGGARPGADLAGHRHADALGLHRPRLHPPGRHRRAHGERIEELRRDGLAGLLVSALTMRTFVRAGAGDHAGAFADAGEAVELAAHLGQVADAATAHEALAWQSAARGLHEAATESLERSAALLEQAGVATAAAHHALNAAYCALSRDDLGAVASILEERIAVDGGIGSMGEPLGSGAMLIEAYVGLGPPRRGRRPGPTARRGHARRRSAGAGRAAAASAWPSSPTTRTPPAPGSRPRWRRTPRRPTSSRWPGPGSCSGRGCAGAGIGWPRASSSTWPPTRSGGWS